MEPNRGGFSPSNIRYTHAVTGPVEKLNSPQVCLIIEHCLLGLHRLLCFKPQPIPFSYLRLNTVRFLCSPVSFLGMLP